MKTGYSKGYCKPLLIAILKGFEKRSGYLLNFNDEKSHAALIATVTHPFFKLRWIASEERTPEFIEQVINILANAANEIYMENLNQENNATSVSRNKESNGTKSVEETGKPKNQIVFSH